MKPTLLRAIPLLFAVSLFFAAGSPGQDPGSEQSGPDAETQERIDACIACHSADGGAVEVHLDKLRKSPHASFDCQSCHSAITELPHTDEMVKEKPTCATCHDEQVEAFNASTHSREDYVRGDHPSCVMCHGNGDSHAITAGSKWTRKQKVKVCTQCHNDKERMARYHVDPDAVPSYHESFHGKALLRFGNLNTAICTDCHGHHDVLAPTNPKSPTHANNAAKTCAQSGCHPGAEVNFAMSGANHLRLKVKDEPLLSGIVVFFQILIFGTIAFMMANVLLDLRKVVLRSEEPPPCGRPAGFLIFLSFVSLIAAIAMAAVKAHGVRYFGFAAVAFLALAYVAFLLRPKSARHAEEGPHYPRMNLNLRLQHILLTLSILVLMATGLPLRFADSSFASGAISLFGGLESARLMHRIAAVGLITTWTWHLLYLIFRWAKAGWSFKSWTMLPTKKDAEDFGVTMKGYLGLTKEEPKFGRYTFRSKVDYLAEYWGLPVMVLSGFVLWFPLYFSSRLSDTAWGIAIIAHGYEATLALLAIICWHLYNVHFSPNVFPMSKIWLKGTISRAEMAREHPMELAQIEGVADFVPQPNGQEPEVPASNDKEGKDSSD